MRISIPFCLTIVLALFLQYVAAEKPYAQTTNGISGTLRGQVTDALTQRPLSNAQIEVIDNGTKLRQTESDATGRFEIVGVAEGVYTLRATAMGYRIASDQNVRAVAGKITQVDFAMSSQVAGFEDLTVVGAAIDADPFAAVTATRISRAEIRSAVGSGGDSFRGLDSLPDVIARSITPIQLLATKICIKLTGNI